MQFAGFEGIAIDAHSVYHVVEDTGTEPAIRFTDCSVDCSVDLARLLELNRTQAAGPPLRRILATNLLLGSAKYAYRRLATLCILTAPVEPCGRGTVAQRTRVTVW